MSVPQPLSNRAASRLKVVFYAWTSTVRGDGKTFGGPDRQFRTFADAQGWLDAQGTAGHVAMWSERSQSRDAVGTRTADGKWTKRDATGVFVPLDAEAREH